MNERATQGIETHLDDNGGAAPGGDAVDLPIDVLGARIRALAGRIAQATYHLLTMLAEFDEREGWGGVGIKSCAHWLAWTCSMAPGTAREHVRVARALRTLPIVSAEMKAGHLSYSKVREITRVADRLDEAEFVEFARTATASQLARSVRAFRRAEGDRGRQEQQRRASWFTDADGSVVISARIPAEEGATVVAALEAARDDLWEAERRGYDQAADSRIETSRTLVRIDPADALLQCARGYLATAPSDRSGEDRATVVVHVAAEHLVAGPGPDEGEKRSRGNADSSGFPDVPDSPGRPAVAPDCCEIAGVGGIEPETARRMACDAVLIGVLRGTGGVTLAHGRRRRRVSEAQRRVLQIRDGQCQFPGCERVSHLEAHHVRHWSRGGRTDLDNLILLCRFHHVACHEGGVRLEPAPGFTRERPAWLFFTEQGQPMNGVTTADGRMGWRNDSWILWHGLDGSRGWDDPEAASLRPRWAGEPFSLDETVRALFGSASRRATTAAAGATNSGPAGDRAA